MVDIQLLIFDCDGVLVDSETIAHEVLVFVLADLGVSISLAHVWGAFFGKTVPQCIEIIESLSGQPVTAEFVALWRERLYSAFRERPVQAVPGVREVLDKLSMPVCVVSNGPVAKMETTLGVTDLLRYFNGKLFSPDLGLPGKPAPDLFLAAAERAGADPRNCVVIEDSAAGVKGARAAGMRVFGFTGLPHVDGSKLREAGVELFDDMQHLPELLSR